MLVVRSGAMGDGALPFVWRVPVLILLLLRTLFGEADTAFVEFSGGEIIEYAEERAEFGGGRSWRDGGFERLTN